MLKKFSLTIFYLFSLKHSEYLSLIFIIRSKKTRIQTTLKLCSNSFVSMQSNFLYYIKGINEYISKLSSSNSYLMTKNIDLIKCKYSKINKSIFLLRSKFFWRSLRVSQDLLEKIQNDKIGYSISSNVISFCILIDITSFEDSAIQKIILYFSILVLDEVFRV
jgi:hypothetical protein